MGLWFIIALAGMLKYNRSFNNFLIFRGVYWHTVNQNFTLYSLSCGILGCESLRSGVLTCHCTLCPFASLGGYVAMVSVPNSMAIFGYCPFRITWTAKDIHTLVLRNNASDGIVYAAVQYCCGCNDSLFLLPYWEREGWLGCILHRLRYVREVVWYRRIGFLPILSAQTAFVDVAYNMVSRTLLCANGYQFACLCRRTIPRVVHLFSGKERREPWLYSAEYLPF